MTLTSASTENATQRPAWLLVLTLPTFVGYLVLAVATIATKVETSSAELTPGQLSELGPSWVALHLLWIAPSVLAAAGLTQLASRAQLRHAGVVRTLACLAVVLSAAYLVVQLLAFGFDGENWGDSRLYGAGVVLSLAVSWSGTLPATILVAVALASRGVARRAMWAVAAVILLYLVVELLTYLPALVGSPTLADTVGLPPFLLGILWAVVGGMVLRARVTSKA